MPDQAIRKNAHMLACPSNKEASPGRQRSFNSWRACPEATVEQDHVIHSKGLLGGCRRYSGWQIALPPRSDRLSPRTGTPRIYVRYQSSAALENGTFTCLRDPLKQKLAMRMAPKGRS